MLNDTESILKNRVRKYLGMKAFKVMSAPTLLYWSETLRPTQRNLSKVQSAEMKFLNSIKVVDITKNEQIRKELKNCICRKWNNRMYTTTRWKKQIPRAGVGTGESYEADENNAQMTKNN